MKKALVFNDSVVQVEDEEFPVHSSMQWIEFDETNDDIYPGWRLKNNKFVPPKAHVTETTKEKAEKKLSVDPIIIAFIRGLSELRGETEAQTRTWIQSKIP
jgi:hypothetical protein